MAGPRLRPGPLTAPPGLAARIRRAVRRIVVPFAVALPAMLALLTLGGCGDDGDPGTTGPAHPVHTDLLVGVWLTRGEDPDLGVADVVMDLRADSSLRIVASVDGGGSLTFPGTWSLDGQRLRLRGAWFRPDGEIEVGFTVTTDTLILDDAGVTQTWHRQA